jgi:hypothetical protein
MSQENFVIETDVCDIVRTNPSKYGAFLNEQSARERLNDFFEITGLDRRNSHVIFGQLLGLDALRTFMSKIETYNTERQPDEQIAGVRIYRAMSKRAFLPPPINEQLLEDVLLMPVLASGEDLFSINKMADPDPDMTLGDAMPCPNQCQTGFYWT